VKQTLAGAGTRSQPGDGSRRELAATLGLGLLAGVMVSYAVNRPWAALTTRTPGLPPDRVSVSGSDVLPLLSALGAVVLAGTLVTVATRGAIRRIAGAVLLVTGAAVVLGTATIEPTLASALHDRVVGAAGTVASDTVGSAATPWRWVCLLGGTAAVAFGALVTLRGSTWPAMGARYDAPSTPARPDEPDADLWRALDRGEDPTRNAPQ
jgi:uncharacterized membrane protein (TIGR02234 family)